MSANGEDWATLADTLTVADTLSAGLDYVIATADSITVTDLVVTGGNTFSVTLADTITVDDDYTGGIVLINSILDSISVFATVNGYFFWQDIDDTQFANWTQINNVQSAGWVLINTNS